MNTNELFIAIGHADSGYLEHSDLIPIKKSRRGLRRTLIAIAAVVALLGVTAALAAGSGYDILGWITGAINRGGEDAASPALVQAQLDEGQWAYLNGDNIAVIIPSSPVKIMLSSDSGGTWRESVVTGSESMVLFGDMRDDMLYQGGFIGFFGDGGGYLILTAGVAMNNQPMRIYLTADGGETWLETGSPYSQHSSVITGAGFSSPELGFVSYRYYDDCGPDIWHSCDGGETWERLEIALPADYQAEQYRFTPQSPVFDGTEGEYPISVLDMNTEAESSISMYTHDGGLTWSFEGY